MKRKWWNHACQSGVPSFGAEYNSHNSQLGQLVNVLLCSPAFREGEKMLQFCPSLFVVSYSRWGFVPSAPLSPLSEITTYRLRSYCPSFTPCSVFLSFFFPLSALKAPFRNRRRSVAIVNSRPRLASPRTNEHSLRLTLPSYRKEPKA